MPGGWSDERERGWDRVRGEDGQERWPGGEDRSFGRGERVFGERESGVGYNRPQRETRPDYAADHRGRDADDRPGWQDRDYGGVSPGFRQHEHDYETGYRSHPRSQGRDHPGGGRFYGIDPASAEGRRFGAQERDGRYDRAFRDEGHTAFEDRAREAGEYFRRTGRRVASWFNDVAGEGSELGRLEARARGLGPKGYQRSDERISDDAHERLTDDPWLDASDIELAITGGEATLSGLVADRDAKHRAERIVEDVFGVSHVQNNLRVKVGGPETARTQGDAAMETSANATHTTTRRN